MQLKINLPEKTLRKMKALDALQGEDSGDFLSMIAEYIDQAVTMQIATCLGFYQQEEPSPQNVSSQYDGVSRSQYAVAAGLSDETYEEEKEESKAHGKASSVNLRAIEMDNQVEDPEKEAVSPDDTDMTFSEAFELMAGGGLLGEEEDTSMPQFSPIPDIPEVPLPRAKVKKLPKSVRAIVSGHTGVESEPR